MLDANCGYLCLGDWNGEQVVRLGLDLTGCAAYSTVSVGLASSGTYVRSSWRAGTSETLVHLSLQVRRNGLSYTE